MTSDKAGGSGTTDGMSADVISDRCIFGLCEVLLNSNFTQAPRGSATYVLKSIKSFCNYVLMLAMKCTTI